MSIKGYKPKWKRREYLGPIAEAQRQRTEQLSAEAIIQDAADKHSQKLKKLCEKNASTSNHSPAVNGDADAKSFSSIRRTPTKKPCKESIKPPMPFQTSPKPLKRLRQFSKRRSIVSQLYKLLRDIFLAQNHMCAGNSNSRSEDVHHRLGKNSTLMLDWRFWMPVSRKIHNWIGDNPKEARAKGWIAEFGQWNTPPDDQRTRELKEIIECATIQNDLPEAKRMLTALARSSGLLTDSPAPTK